MNLVNKLKMSKKVTTKMKRLLKLTKQTIMKRKVMIKIMLKITKKFN